LSRYCESNIVGAGVIREGGSLRPRTKKLGLVTSHAFNALFAVEWRTMIGKIANRLPVWSARLLLAVYCSIIFTISSFSRPEQDYGLPTGGIPHFIEYSGLGILAWLNFWGKRKKRIHRIGLALVFCAIYAASDELHQAFVPLRACELKDWIVDMAGSLSGILIMERKAGNKGEKQGKWQQRT